MTNEVPEGVDPGLLEVLAGLEPAVLLDVTDLDMLDMPAAGELLDPGLLEVFGVDPDVPDTVCARPDQCAGWPANSKRS